MEKEFTTLIATHKCLLIRICNTYFYKNMYAEDFLQEIIIHFTPSLPLEDAVFQVGSKFQ